MSSTLVRLQAIGMLTLEPERLKNQLATTRQKITGDGKGSSPETLKRLAILVSQRRSFLPSSKVSVMAAILRASVRRTIVGLMPLASDAW